MASINWYPGHMKKTSTLIEEHLKQVDVVVELLDARIPKSSKNPHLRHIIGEKPVVTVVNKMDLADEQITAKYVHEYSERGLCLPMNSMVHLQIRQLISLIFEAGKPVSEKLKRQGRKQRAIRTMVVGVPNVGKSSLLNRLANRNAATTGNKPGVTKGKQWVKTKNQIEILDMPGILWPKIEDDQTGYKLCITGAIRDDIVAADELAFQLLVMTKPYWDLIINYYGVDRTEEPLHLMQLIGKKRGLLSKGGVVDMEKASRRILDDYRKGMWGKISLDE